MQASPFSFPERNIKKCAFSLWRKWCYNSGEEGESSLSTVTFRLCTVASATAGSVAATVNIRRTRPDSSFPKKKKEKKKFPRSQPKPSQASPHLATAGFFLPWELNNTHMVCPYKNCSLPRGLESIRELILFLFFLFFARRVFIRWFKNKEFGESLPAKVICLGTVLHTQSSFCVPECNNCLQNCSTKF